MIKGKVTVSTLLNIVLVAVLLTSMFLVNSTTSRGGKDVANTNKYGVTTTYEYDPWLDYDGNGIIDYEDLFQFLVRYGTEGDPTRNVTIVGHASKLIRAAVGERIGPNIYWLSSNIPVDGYSKVSINIGFTTNLNYYELDTKDYSGTIFFSDTVTNFDYNLVKTYDVMNQQIQVLIWNKSADTAYLYLDIYLMA